MRYIEELKDNERVLGHYYCKSKQSLKTKSNKTYLSLQLQDKTGMIDAKIWELNNEIQSFEEKDFIKIDGQVVVYNNQYQIKISKVRKSNEGEYDERDFVPTTDKDVENLYNKMVELINSVSNSYIKKLLENIFVADKEVIKIVKSNSAAKSMHHGYMGGLIEHLVSVAEICDFLCTRYKHANRDIIIAGALLHDIGKIYELSPFPENDYTDDGELLGHIVMGVEIITKEAATIDGFPKELLSLIKHCVVSHHGEYEFGSPQLPKIIEAMIVHAADNLDSKVKMYEEALEKSDPYKTWVGFHHVLRRNLRKSSN